MTKALVDLSDSLADVVESAGRWVVAVAGHPRFASSGILWTPNIVVSAARPLKGYGKAEITMPSGAQLTAETAGSDPATDIAVFRIEHDVAPESSQTRRAGAITLVVGRSASSGLTASMGIISSHSGAWRTWRGGAVDEFIRLDTALYPSSNGGAVVDAEGRLIGLATAAFSRYGSVAIPAATVNRVVDAILRNGHVPRGYLGVGLQPVSHKEERGLIVLSVDESSAAATAGWLVGDILTALDGKPTHDAADVQAFLGSEYVGKSVTAQIIRAGAKLDVPITIGERRREACG